MSLKTIVVFGLGLMVAIGFMNGGGTIALPDGSSIADVNPQKANPDTEYIDTVEHTGSKLIIKGHTGNYQIWVMYPDGTRVKATHEERAMLADEQDKFVVHNPSQTPGNYTLQIGVPTRVEHEATVYLEPPSNGSA